MDPKQLISTVNRVFPGCYLTLHHKEGWSIRTQSRESKLIEYGNGLTKLYELLAEKDYTPNDGPTARSYREIETPVIPYNTEQDSLDWLQLAKDSYYGGTF